MGTSIIELQKQVILDTIKNITRGDWKVLVIDESSRRIVDNVVKEDDILNQNVANIERIEDRRGMSGDMDAIYILSPQAHVVDALIADFERRRYRRSFLVWTAILDPQLRRRIDSSPAAQKQLGGFETLSIDYFPRESHLVTFRDPWSFPMLYHPACNTLVASHMQMLATKIVGVCVTLGEYPKVRYYRPRQPLHEASVLCSHLARFIQDELDAYAQWNRDFPPPSSRPQGVLFITDRSMDLQAPLVHEFTYQAMAHDLLPIKETDKVYYKTVVNEGAPDEQEKDMEIGEKDEIWVKNRHMHMKDTIEKLMGDFQKFIDENPHFTSKSGDASSLNAIKDMLAGLPQFQELKEAYSLHLSMAQECMNIFQNRKLPDIASVEQSLATGLDEDYRKPKNIADQVVRLLDDNTIGSADRLRLILLYILFREGVIAEDVSLLLAHADLPAREGELVSNLELLGARCIKTLKDSQLPIQPLFARRSVPPSSNEEYALSRFEPALKRMLDDASKGVLDPIVFPYTKPPLDNESDMMATQASLRSAKPTWAQNKKSNHESKQRVIVFMAGGATYSEARACYETSRSYGKDVFLATSHLLTPASFVRQLGDLSADRRRLDLPVDRPKPKAPAHLFEREEKKPPAGLPAAPATKSQSAGLPAASTQNGSRVPPPPTVAMASINLNANAIPPMNNGTGHPTTITQQDTNGRAKLEKRPKEVEEKKKRHFFSSKK